MDVKAAEKMIQTLMKETNVPEEWRYEIKGRGSRIVGFCSYNCRLLQFSKKFIALNTEENVKMIVLHEIAHALTPNDRGHGYSWQAKAVEFGVPPKASLNARDYGIILK